MTQRSCLGQETGSLEPVLVRVLFPSVFVQVLVQVLVEFLILFRHLPARPISIPLLNVAVRTGPSKMKAVLLPMADESYPRAAKVIRRGGLVVYPTDTVYGLGCDPFNARAVRKLFEAKGRTTKPVPVLCSSLEKAEELVVFGAKAERLAEEHWPGALTIVAPLSSSLPSQLTQWGPNLGVRVPNHPGCLKLIEACGGRLTGTSANLSGRPSARSAGEAVDQLGDSVDLVLDGGRLQAKESTVVQVVGEAVTILRTGPVGVAVE
jgi:L-threonylcarbamoyladenylate synthase